MSKLRVNVGKGYDIIIEKGAIKNCGNLISDVSKAKKVMIITDSNVAKLHLDDVKSSIEKANFEVFTHIFEAGESSKKITTVNSMIEDMADCGLTRNDLVVALGGGVCGDMAGFAAAIYFRGIDFVQVSTTLLAQIDSSVGGKTGVDLPQGKNLCGAFHQPILVVIDPDALNTLSDKFFSDGIAEAIKYGCIKSPLIFERLLEEDAKQWIEELIFHCVDIKAGVVERDEKEQGERALLNFGHTIGHAIEKHYNFETYSHGEAVGIGMVMITEISEKLGITEQGSKDRIVELLKKYNLPTSCDAPTDSIISAMGMDKKRTGCGINFIMLNKIGDSFINPISSEKIKELF